MQFQLLLIVVAEMQYIHFSLLKKSLLNFFVYGNKSSQYGLYILGRMRVTKVVTIRYESLSSNNL